MPFVQGKCESCGGILTVDPSLKAANCPFCGTAYVFQDSINYYNTTIKVDTMHPSVVNVSEESSSEGRIKAGDALLKLGKFEKAEMEYKKATELAPQNYKGWLGLIESYTQNYSKRIRFSSELHILSDYSRSVKMFAPDELSNSILQKLEEYLKGEIEKNTSEVATYKNAIAAQNSALKQLNEQKSSLMQNYNQNQQIIDSLNTQPQKKHKSNTTIVSIVWTIIQVLIGCVFFVINPFIGILILLAAGIPAAIFLIQLDKDKKPSSEIARLISEQEIIQKQISVLSDQERACCVSIQANEKELDKYAL